MARRRKSNKATDGGGLGLIIVGMFYGIYNFIVAHKETAIMVAVAVAVLIVLFILIKAIRRHRYWAWYYSRERGLEEIGTGHMLQQETNDALNNILCNVQGCRKRDYTNLRNAFEKAYKSDEIVYLNSNNEISYRHDPSAFSGNLLLDRINVNTDGSAIDIYCKTDEDGGYHFVVLPNVVYAFITGPKSFTFVAAYSYNIFNLKVKYSRFRKEYRHITDMSHEPSGYFLRYCDIHDSDAAEAGWQYETANGYRDGRRQGNNCFIVKFLYTNINFQFGKFTIVMAFSNTASGEKIKDRFAVYKAMDRNTIQKPITYQDAEVITDTTVDESLKQDKTKITVVDGPITCEEARTRNRNIAKAVQSELNQMYNNDLEFKVFQIKKEREDRQLQDASVYTYIGEGKSRYCLEYNIHTELESGKTQLEYILTADDEAVLQEAECQRIIKDNTMIQVGSSFRMLSSFEYNRYASDNAVELLVNNIRRLVDEARKK